MQWRTQIGAAIIAVVEAAKYLTLLYMVQDHHIVIGATLIAGVEAAKYLVLKWMVK